MTGQPFLVLTVCHHLDQEFYDLGRLEFEIPTDVAFQGLPSEPPHDCDTAAVCLMVDYWANEDAGISDDREITPAIADALLNGEYGVRLQAARDDLAAYYKAAA